MPKFFLFLRWIFAPPVILLFFIVALIGIPASAITGTISRSDAVKAYLKQSGIYSDTLPILLGMAAKSSGGESDVFFKEWEAHILNPETDFGNIAAKIGDPATVERKVETVIDATYAWMEGKTPRPVFEIALLDNRQDFLKLLALGFHEKARSLPPCGVGYKMSGNFDPLSTPCWPNAIQFSEIDRFFAANADAKEFDSLFAKAKFDSQNLEIPPETTTQVQRAFFWIQLTQWALLAALMTIAILLIILLPRFWTGIKIIGAAIFIPSLIIFFGRMMAIAKFDLIFDLVSKKISQGEQAIFLAVFEKISKTLYFGLLASVNIYSIIGMAIGITLMLAASLAKANRLAGR